MFIVALFTIGKKQLMGCWKKRGFTQTHSEWNVIYPWERKKSCQFYNIDGPWRHDAKICVLLLIFIYFYNEIWIMTYIMKIVILAYILF